MTEPERAGHRERLRKKFLEHGLDKFTDEEIVELLLTFATPRRDCKQQARQAMAQFKTLRNLFEAPTEELTKISGIGPNNAFGIKFIHQITRKFLRERMMNRPYLNSSEEVLEYLYHAMRSLTHEAFRVIYLSAAHEIVNEETIAVGTATEVPVTPRQIVERAVKNGSASIVLAHNHPGGEPAPSDEDRLLTRETAFLCGMMGLRLLEHLIIAPGGHFSFAQEGHLAEYDREFQKFYSKLSR
ncbi:MAG: DNA repair protein RadC [Nitrospinae bacterium]|nr:DNA repair protein RadC [Nitrospinota bacterium]